MEFELLLEARGKKTEEKGNLGLHRMFEFADAKIVELIEGEK